MTKQLKHFVAGVRQSLVVAPDQQYVVPARGDFSRDASSLREAARNVARDLNKTTEAHGKQIYNR